MKFVGFVVVLQLMCFASVAQDVCVKARRLVEKINKVHIQPRDVNDSLSADIFSEFFKRLDPDFEFFLAKDTGSLVRYRYRLENNDNTACDFVEHAATFYGEKILKYSRLVDSIFSKPFDFSKNESIPAIIGKERNGFSKSSAELNALIVRNFKYQVLSSMYRQAASDSINLLNLKTFEKFETAARQRIKRNALVNINRLLKDERELHIFVDDSYLKSIPKVFDPHSDYFSKAEMNSFTEDLNPSELSFGIKLEESAMGEVIVSKVVPGGPAWKSNQVNKGDALISLTWRGTGETIDLIDLDVELVTTILEKPGETSADVTLRKTTGERREVKLVKEKLENEDNIVTGFVLKGKEKMRSIGYISLPGFFTDDNSENNGCAVAVTKELIKLKGEGIEGLILDLRFNGGGSLAEAIELAGIFIDNGPVGVIESRGENPVTMKDMNRGLVYDGPMVIMINGGSASASEVVAAALQDYRRAVIAGSTSYGKATGQLVLPVDDARPDDGFVKITDMRIYRVTGQSHQLMGVVPDFPINDLSSMMFLREEQEDFALQQKSVNKKTYYNQWPAPNKTVLQDTQASIHSQRLDAIAKVQEFLNGDIPLEANAFVNFMKKLDRLYKLMASSNGSENNRYNVINTRYDAVVLKADAYHAEMSNMVMGQIRSSIYIQEVYQLLDNLLATKSK